MSMSCARARSCQTSHAINAALSIANSPSHSLLTPGAGRWELDRAFKTVLPSDIPVCLLPHTSAPSCCRGCAGGDHLKGSFYTPDSQPAQILPSEMFPCTISICPAVMLSPLVQPQGACSSFHGNTGASPCEPWGHKDLHVCVLASVNSHYPEDPAKSLRRDMTSARLCFAGAQACLRCP